MSGQESGLRCGRDQHCQGDPWIAGVALADLTFVHTECAMMPHNGEDPVSDHDLRWCPSAGGNLQPADKFAQIGAPIMPRKMGRILPGNSQPGDLACPLFTLATIVPASPAFLPRAAALVLALPPSVLAAYLTVMVAALFATGMKQVVSGGLDHRRTLN